MNNKRVNYNSCRLSLRTLLEIYQISIQVHYKLDNITFSEKRVSQSSYSSFKQTTLNNTNYNIFNTNDSVKYTQSLYYNRFIFFYNH